MTEESAACETVAPLVGTLPPQCQKDLDTLRRFVHTTISPGVPADPVCAADFREVLLTGATGFVGRFLLRDLLQHKTDLVVHCLVRADNVEHGFDRLRAALREAEIWEEAFTPRIRVVVGDIAKAWFGLDKAAFDILCRRIDAVYHFAADLTLTKPYGAIRTANTFSIRNVLELCLRVRYKHVFYASTLGVFPQYFCAFGNEFRHCGIGHQEQPRLAAMKRLFPLGVVGYPWSKLIAEQSLLFAQAAGLPVGIFRLPQINGASTGATQPDAIGVRLIAAMADVELIPQGFSIQRVSEAVDVLSEVCAAVSMNPRRRFTIYHCCDTRAPLHELEFADFGLYWPEVSYASFKSACQARGESSPLYGHWALLDHFAPYWFGERDIGGALPVCDRAIREDCPLPIRWPGSMTLFRRSNDWIERQQKWPYPLPKSRLDFDSLISQAKRHARRAGVPFKQTYPQWMRCNLQRLVQAINAPEAKLLERHRGSVVWELSRLLRHNAALARERQQYPEIERQEVPRPVFIVGINRTGTTFLHRLMAQDERFWALCGYEYFEPVRPAHEYATLSGTPADPRRASLEDMFEAAGIVKNFAGIHHFAVDQPEEDFPLMRLGFAAWTVTVRYHLPEYCRWLAACDMRSAYAHHRSIMQHFTWQRRQRQAGSRGQWLFKMPFHLMGLDALIETYPDALFIQTHREPVQFMGSWNSLVKRARSIATEPRPLHQLGTEQLDFMSDVLDRAVDFRLAHPELEHRWIDVNYFNLIEDPLAVVRGIYQRFNWPLEPAAIDAMDDWLFRQAIQRQQQARHCYALEDYGLTPQSVNTAFAHYRDFITSHGIRSAYF